MKEENNNWLLYVLYDKNKLEEGVRYVGITSISLKERIRHHFSESKRFPNRNNSRISWLSQQTNKTLGFQIVKRNMSKDEAGEFERLVISVHKELGYNLVNTTEGGFNKYTRHHSKETRERLSILNTGKKLADETKNKLSDLNSGALNPMYGKKHTDESCKKMSEAIRQYYLNYKKKSKKQSIKPNERRERTKRLKEYLKALRAK